MSMAKITSPWPSHTRSSGASTETFVSDSLASSTVVGSAYSDPKPSQWLAESQRYSKLNRIMLVILGVVVLCALTAGMVFWIVSFYAFPPRYSTDYSNVPFPTPFNTTIVHNPSFHQSFYGLGYTPSDTQYPKCGATQNAVLEDMKVLSQLTTRLRIYGMDCDAANYTLNAIKLLKVNMSTLLTIWVDDNESTYNRQKQILFDLIEEYGIAQIEGVSVGNEVLYRNKTAEPSLIQKMQALRAEFDHRHLQIPITTTDVANLQDDDVMKAEDVVMANIHPYFGGVGINDASNWTMAFSQKHLVKPAKANGKANTGMAEVGWPTRGEANGESVPSVANLQTFVDDFVCHANSAGVKYYFFEAFDEPWKSQESELEGSWGIMDGDRNLKVRIPIC